jgi:cardiolipin synthase A/B
MPGATRRAMKLDPIVVEALPALLVLAVQACGLIAAGHALMAHRTTQGTIAWTLLLVIFPYIGLPLYLVFGINRFQAYVHARRALDQELGFHLAHLEDLHVSLANLPGDTSQAVGVSNTLAKIPLTRGNAVELLVDGAATFGSIFDGLRQARHYILIQFFTVAEDDLGRDLQQLLIERAQAGVAVFFLFDEIGSRHLPRHYVEALRAAGVRVHPFRTGSGWEGRLRLNFRNHRKIVVVDGVTGWVGGHNVSDTYLGRNPRFGPWRDTHVRIAGPAVLGLQLAFAEDWFWLFRFLPEWNWQPVPQPANQAVLVLPTGPADVRDTCSLAYIEMIHAARQRLWLHSPYFVPDEAIVTALELATLRGVDVRILLPERPDHLLVWLSSFFYIAHPALNRVKFMRYQPGFLHSKTILIDTALAGIGSINLDNRSFHINFEAIALVACPRFAAAVAAMMDADWRRARPAAADDFHRRSLLFRIAVRAARLMSPLQ